MAENIQVMKSGILRADRPHFIAMPYASRYIVSISVYVLIATMLLMINQAAGYTNF